MAAKAVEDDIFTDFLGGVRFPGSGDTVPGDEDGEVNPPGGTTGTGEGEVIDEPVVADPVVGEEFGTRFNPQGGTRTREQLQQRNEELNPDLTTEFSTRFNPQSGTRTREQLQERQQQISGDVTQTTSSIPEIIEPADIQPAGLAADEVTQESQVAVEPKEIGLEPDKVETKAAFTFTNPLTGQVEEFETIEDRNKREKQVAEEAIDKQEQDKIAKAGNDFLTQSADFLADLANPDTPDPIKTAALNELIATFGPENQAAMDSLLVTLKNDNLEGTGAGNAMLLLMARGNQAQFSNMRQRLNTESAQRIYDMNKFGAELGLKIRRQVNDEKQQKFQNDGQLFSVAVESGDFATAGRIAADLGLVGLDTSKLEKMSDFELANFVASSLDSLGFKVEGADEFSKITGLDLDTSNLAGLDEATQKIISDRLKAIAEITDPEARKQAMIQLAQEHPEAFGFPGDPDGAVATVEAMDFSNSDANAKIQDDTMKFWRQESITDSPNLDAVISQGTSFWEPYDDATIDNRYTNAEANFANLDPDSQQLILDGMAALGVSSLDEIDTRKEKEAFLSLTEFDKQRQNLGGISQEIFDELGVAVAGTDLEQWFDGSDPVRDGIVKTWIADNVVIGGNFTRDPETGLLTINLEDIAKPWDENYNQFEFMTWPRKTWDADGNLIGTTYNGSEFRDDLDPDSVFNDPAEIAEDERLTNAYLKYKKENPDGLNWLDWYDTTQGGTIEIEQDFDIVSTTQDFIQNSANEFSGGLTSGDFSGLTEDEWFSVFENNPAALTELQDSGQVETFDSANITSNSIIRKEDFLALGLRADVEIDNNIDEEGKQPDTGVGTGNGSIIIVNGRPARVVAWVSDSQTSESGFFRERRGNIMVEYLDEDPATREAVKVGGSTDWVDI